MFQRFFTNKNQKSNKTCKKGKNKKYFLLSPPKNKDKKLEYVLSSFNIFRVKKKYLATYYLLQGDIPDTTGPVFIHSWYTQDCQISLANAGVIIYKIIFSVRNQSFNINIQILFHKFHLQKNAKVGINPTERMQEQNVKGLYTFATWQRGDYSPLLNHVHCIVLHLHVFDTHLFF